MGFLNMSLRVSSRILESVSSTDGGGQGDGRAIPRKGWIFLTSQPLDFAFSPSSTSRRIHAAPSSAAQRPRWRPVPPSTCCAGSHSTGHGKPADDSALLKLEE